MNVELELNLVSMYFATSCDMSGPRNFKTTRQYFAKTKSTPVSQNEGKCKAEVSFGVSIQLMESNWGTLSGGLVVTICGTKQSSVDTTEGRTLNESSVFMKLRYKQFLLQTDSERFYMIQDALPSSDIYIAKMHKKKH